LGKVLLKKGLGPSPKKCAVLREELIKTGPKERGELEDRVATYEKSGGRD